MAVHATSGRILTRTCNSRQPFVKSARNLRNMRPRASLYEGTKLRAPLNDESPVLYTHVLCPYAQRAWLALLEKGALFRIVNVDLSCKPSWYMRVNPAGLVPAVAYKGHVQTESLDICSWVDSELAGRPLVIKGREGATQRLMRDCGKFVSAGMSFLAGTTGRSWGIGSGQTDSQKQSFLRQVRDLSRHLEEWGGPFLTGDQPSLADIAYYPFAERFALTMLEFCGLDLRSAEGGTLGHWLAAMEQRESVQTSSPERRLFLQALKAAGGMTRRLCRSHRSLDFFDFQSYSATQLHPHFPNKLLVD